MTLMKGAGPLVLKLERTGTFGVGICYDNAFPEHFMRATKDGAEWHLILSNEAWYKGGAELDQMVAMSVIDAIVCGRAILRCTNSGITCLIGPCGNIEKVLKVGGKDRGVKGYLRTVIPIEKKETFMVSISTWFTFFMWIAVFLLSFICFVWPTRIFEGRISRK